MAPPETSEATLDSTFGSTQVGCGVDNVFFARAQMGMSLAFHIIFASVGIGMPVLMAVAEGISLRTKNPVYLELARRWAIGTAILFAVGAVSGTVLSFELGLLFPKFMEHAGAIIGMPFSLEGFAFFTEAIFLGIFLYGWKRISPLMHWLAGGFVAISGIFSGIFVVTANAWMNSPTGFEFKNGTFSQIDPIAAMLNPASLHQVIHMILGALVGTGFVVAGVHAFYLLRDHTSEFHRKAFAIAAAVGCVTIPLQVLTGDFAARRVAKLQPAKFAAMEAHYHTTRGAPLIIGGIPDSEKMEVRHGIEIPYGLSVLAGDGPNAEVRGLDKVPRDEWPNVKLVHWSFDLMVGFGTFMLGIAVLTAIRRRSVYTTRWLLRLYVIATPLGLMAVELGWFVTEFGRQPWVIYGILRTREAATPMPGLVVPFTVFTGVYIFLSVVLVFLLRRQFSSVHSPQLEKRHGA
jgi:cytochrome bd ubiquinol oxidase subunit I